MIRYLAIATVLVLSIAVIATAWVDRDLIRIHIASVVLRVPPKPAAPLGMGSGGQRPLRGDAPWALSALPECLEQVEESHGTIPYVRAHLPEGALPIAPPAKLAYRDCTISLVDDEAIVRRGSDRFRIPPHVRFYRSGDELVLFRVHGTTADLRIYQRSTMMSQ